MLTYWTPSTRRFSASQSAGPQYAPSGASTRMLDELVSATSMIHTSFERPFLRVLRNASHLPSLLNSGAPLRDTPSVRRRHSAVRGSKRKSW